MRNSEKVMRGCSRCRVENCDALYRGSQCAFLRSRVGADFDPRTVAEALVDQDEATVRHMLDAWIRVGCQCHMIPLRDGDISALVADMVEWLRQPICFSGGSPEDVKGKGGTTQ